jgi:hypothetical protein
MVNLYKNFTDKAKELLGDLSNYTNVSEDEPLCAICEKRIINDVPLRCFALNKNLEISFHPECALKGYEPDDINDDLEEEF